MITTPNVRPLEHPLRELPTFAQVYVVRYGLVFVYPACALDDVANDRYLNLRDDWSAWSKEYDAGELYAFRLRVRQRKGFDTSSDRKMLARELWRAAGGPDTSAFDWFWDSIDLDADPAIIGAATMVAARSLMNFPLFKLRHLDETTAVS